MSAHLIRAVIGVLLVSLVTSACGGGGPPPSATPTLPPVATNAQAAALTEATYRVGSGDRIRVAVFRHEDLSGEYALDGAGNFAMPLLGEIRAGGLTPRELEQRIQNQLRDGYLVDPQVSIEVLNYRPFYILGEVKVPGSYQYVNGMTVLNAVALAGGFSYRARQNGIIVKRGGTNTEGEVVPGNAPILPGDIIEVPERFF